MSEKPSESKQGESAKKSKKFFWICTGLLLAIMAAFVAIAQLDIFDAGAHVMFAMAIGVIFTILLGVGLMALAFHSDDSGIDDQQ